ncbi:MAG TPA: tetratricopeptide repeat protein [Coleofasciculaceae cyanobacterium]
MGDRQSETTALNSLGNVYSTCQDYKTPEGYYEQRLAIANVTGDR